MNYTFLFHPLVLQHYDKAYKWYENRQEGLGEKFLAAVRKKIEQINLSPETYGKKQSKTFREAPVDIFPYLIVYKINKKKKVIFVSSVHHTKKNSYKKYRKEY